MCHDQEVVYPEWVPLALSLTQLSYPQQAEVTRLLSLVPTYKGSAQSSDTGTGCSRRHWESHPWRYTHSRVGRTTPEDAGEKMTTTEPL